MSNPWEGLDDYPVVVPKRTVDAGSASSSKVGLMAIGIVLAFVAVGVLISIAMLVSNSNERARELMVLQLERDRLRENLREFNEMTERHVKMFRSVGALPPLDVMLQASKVRSEILNKIAAVERKMAKL